MSKTGASAVVVVGESILSPSTGYSVFKANTGTDRFLRGYNTYARDVAGWEVRGGGVGVSNDGNANTSAQNAFATADIVASVSGLTILTESIVSVSTTSPRYHPEVGDVVVGRIIDVSANRWRCEVFGLQDAIMPIRNVTGPGSILRRKGREDELTMRTLFKEDDVFVAEVQRMNLNDGSISLHIRSAEGFGKRKGVGTLVTVRPALVPRLKQQFYVFVDKGPVGLFSLPSSSHAETDAGATPNDANASSEISSDTAGVAVVFGANGGVWVSVATHKQVKERRKQLQQNEAASSGAPQNASSEDNIKTSINSANVDEGKDDEGAEGVEEADQDEAVIANNHRMVALVANCIRLLNARRCLISPVTIEGCLATIFENNWTAFDVVKGGMHGEIADHIISVVAAASAGDEGERATGFTKMVAGKRPRE